MIRLALVLLLLTGCAPSQDAINKFYTDCAAEIPNATRLQRETCAYEKVKTLDMPSKTRSAYDYLYSTRIAVAEKMDEGEMTEAEGNAIIQKTMYEMNAAAPKAGITNCLPNGIGGVFCVNN